MDPNETLRRIRELTRYTLTIEFKDWSEVYGEEFVTLTESLDDWLSKGGFYPDGWHHAATALYERGYQAGYADAIKDEGYGAS